MAGAGISYEEPVNRLSMIFACGTSTSWNEDSKHLINSPLVSRPTEVNVVIEAALTSRSQAAELVQSQTVRRQPEAPLQPPPAPCHPPRGC